MVARRRTWRRGVAVDAARAGGAHRPRGARSGDLFDLFVMPGRRANWELTRALRAAGALTPALLLRSLLGGERDLFAEALAELSGLPAPRVAAFIREPHGEGFAALAHKAGLKSGILPAFRAALAATKTHVGERWRRPETVAGAKGHRRMRAARRSRARPRFWRCCGASPPRRRGRKPRASRARRLRPLRPAGCRKSWTSLPSTTTSQAKRRS